MSLTLKHALLLTLALCHAAAAADLEKQFRAPPEETKPWVYWYWISDNISKAGLTRDLEAMARVGIGEAFIGNVDVNEKSRGPVKVLSEEWWGLVEHAIREGGRLGVNIGLFNCPGWSQSGGPWVKPEQTMRYVAVSETRVQGPAQFARKLPVPKEPFQDLAVLAFPAPRLDTDTVAAHAPRVTCTPTAPDAAFLADGKLDTVCNFPPNAATKEPFLVDLELAEPFTARSLVLHPASQPFAVTFELQAADASGQFQSVRKFVLDRSNANVHVGPLPFGPVAVAFPPVTARQFRLVFTGRSKQGGLAEIELTSAARLERYVEKQLGKMFQTPLPLWDAYLWPPQTEADGAGLAVRADQVLNLSDRLAADGTLRWEVPAGEWVVLRAGMTPTGVKNAPASPEGTGYEVDKMNRQWLAAHFGAFIGELLRRMPAADRKAFRHVVADSYEMGSQNWTDGFAAEFRARYGYDALRWLPVLTGRLVGSADQSDRFLWDVRRLVADRISRDYVGGLRDLCEQNGLRLWLENYGHWGFPGEFLQYGGQSHDLGGEFWATGDLGSIELRAASSAAHIYGKRVVSAEAFTSSGPHWTMDPWWQKRRGDWACTEGANHFVLHVFIHQPFADRVPGVNAWFGTEFNHHNTWFGQARGWIDYLRRTHFLLHQGRNVADVAYFIGEDTPKMTGARKPELPPGYSFDYINAEVIEQRLRVRAGKFVLPDGTSYRLLVLPELATMRPALLRKLRGLVKAGGAVLGPPPSRSPSLEHYPACDEEVKRLADELWGDGVMENRSDATRTTDSSTPTLQHSIPPTPLRQGPRVSRRGCAGCARPVAGAAGRVGTGRESLPVDASHDTRRRAVFHLASGRPTGRRHAVVPRD
ncbi:MAG: glycoside hydrolase family 2 [Verrucomicrobia bacterium]|nr:glycoside hydrolase family 2 [Verrucomicrobiota bacterium]